MVDENLDVPIIVSLAGPGSLDVTFKASLIALGSRDVPIQASLHGISSHNVPIQVSLIAPIIDIGIYGESDIDTAPRKSILFSQGGTPDRIIAPTDPYWLLRSGDTETGKEGFVEIGIGQNTTHDETDANLTGFVRVQQDATSGEGEVKIKPSLWFYPSSEPTTPQEGMLYYDSATHTIKYRDDTTWQTVSSGGMAAHDLTGAYHTEDATGGAGNVIVANSDTTFSWQQLDYTELASIPSTFTPIAHDLISSYHTVSGLTIGHFMKATGTTTFAFSAHGLVASDVGAYTTAQVDSAIDTDITTHVAITDAHHAKYTDAEVEAIITAEIVDGQSIDNAIDSLISTHNVVNNHLDWTASVGTIHTDNYIEYTDVLVEGVITAELVDGQSIDVAIDSLITTHAAIATAHQDAPGLIATHTALPNAHHTAFVLSDFTTAFAAESLANLTTRTHASLSDAPTDAHHAEIHALAITGPHTGALPLVDIASYAQGSIIIGGGSDWEALAAGTETYVLTMGASEPVWAASASGGPGTGTQWTLPVWATTTTLGDSMVSQNSGGTTFTVDGQVNSRKIFFDRATNADSGLQWYNDATFTAWCNYMAQAAQTSVGPRGTITAPSGTLVTSWALRSFAENATGYGWTFESGANTDTTPAVVFEIRASDGAFKSFGGGTIAGALAMSGALTGVTTIATSSTVTVGTDLTVTGGDVFSTDIRLVATTGYAQMKSAAAQHMYFDAGNLFNWRDIDASGANRMTLGSSDGDLWIQGELSMGGNTVATTAVQMRLDVNTDTVAYLYYLDTDQTASCDSSSFSVYHMYYDFVTNSSSIIKKENIVPYESGILSKDFDTINPVSYNLIAHPEKTTLGFVAEWLPEVIRDYNHDGSVSGYNQTGLIAVMVDKIHEQDRAIQALITRIEALEA